MSRSNYYIISAPAGTGKGTVVEQLVKHDNIELSISMTTRAPRSNDIPGKTYHFVSREEFEQKIAEDGFIEYAEYQGNYYGTPKAPVEQWTSEGKDIIFEIEVQGYEKMKKLIPECIGIFILPPSEEELERRLRGRGTETEEQILGRLATAKEEMKLTDRYNYVVVNDTVENCVGSIIEIFEKEKQKK